MLKTKKLYNLFFIIKVKKKLYSCLLNSYIIICK